MYQGKYTKDKVTARKSTESAVAEQPVAVQETQTAPRQIPVRKPRRTSPASDKKSPKLFYGIYFGGIVLFFIAILCVMLPLRNWLINYEASQPSHKRDQVFSQLFETKNWEEIYQLAGLEGNAFENSETFASCMEKLVGDNKLSWLETSAGLSGDKKYIVKLGEEKIASFTLTGGSDSQTEIPQWELGALEVFTQGSNQVTVERLPGQTVYINGIELDDSYVISKSTTLAEDYLPEGIHGFRVELLQLTGLLVAPEVTVKNADGSAAALLQDPDTGIYTQNHVANTATTEEKALALTVAETYGKYMIGKAKLADVRKLFNTNSEFFKTISRSEVGWAQSGASFRFTDPVYSGYYRYSDNLFSIKVDTTLEQTRFDGTVKSYPIHPTLFFEKNSQGNWIVREATNVDVQQKLTQVKLTFLNEDKEMRSEFVDAAAKSLQLPKVTAPEGKQFAGWAEEGLDANGNTTLTIVFQPGENDTVYLPTGNVLKPMTLQAVFEEVK